MLITERAYHGSTDALWKSMGIDGESEIFDSHFRTVPPKPADLAPSDDSTTASPESTQLSVTQQVDNEYSLKLCFRSLNRI